MGVTDERSFEAFLTANYASVQRALSLATGGGQRAQDMTQEAFAQAFRHWYRVSRMDRPVAWVYVVGVNAGRRSLRRELKHEADPRVAVVDHSDSVVAVATIRTALTRLSPRQRLAVVLRYLADLSTTEVAAAMGCAEGTVKSTLHAALSALRVELSEEDE